MHLLSETTQEANAALAANNQPPSSAEGVVGGATSAGVAAEGSTSDVRIEDITESQDNHADLEETEPLEALEPELEQQAEVRASSPLVDYVHTKLQKILVRLLEGGYKISGSRTISPRSISPQDKIPPFQYPPGKKIFLNFQRVIKKI